MRRPPATWTTLWTRLGFQRKRVRHKRKNDQGRQGHLELLEPRQMLSANDPVLTDFVAFGQHEVDLDRNSVVTAGLLGSNNKLHIDQGAATQGLAAGGRLKIYQDVRVTGDVIADGAIFVRKDASIDGDLDSNTYVKLDRDVFVDGDVTSSGRVHRQRNVVISGTLSRFGNPELFTPIVLPEVTDFSTDPSNDIHTRKNEITTLAPGHYGELKLGKDNTLNFSSGSYFFDEIDADDRLRFNLDVSGGNIEIFVAGRTSFDKALDVTVIGGDASDIYLESHDRFRLDHGGEWWGTIFAPDDKIELKKNTTLIGAAYSGREVHIDDKSKLELVPADRLVGSTDTDPPLLTASLSNDTGDSSSDGITFDAGFTGSVTDTSGVDQLLVTIASANGGAPAGPFDITSQINPSDGSFSLDQSTLEGLLGQTLLDGEYTATFAATDSLGNSASQDVSFLLDTLMNSVINLTTPPDGLVTNTNVSISGQITNPQAVSVLGARVDSGPLLSIPFDMAGNFSFPSTLPLDGSADGLHTIQLQLVDVAGNISVPLARDFTLDTLVSAPVIADFQQDTGASDSDGVTSDNTLVFSGTADPGSIVTLSETGLGTIGSASVDAAGDWTLDASATVLADGNYSFLATAQDAAGNTSVTSVPLAVTVDTTAPTTLDFDLAAISDSLPVGDATTTLPLVTLAGTTDPGLTVELLATGATTTAAASGDFTFENVALAIGANLFTMQATDAAGNTSQATRTITRIADDADDVVATLVEGSGFAVEASVLVDLGQAAGSRTLRFEVDAYFDTSNSAAVEDTFLVYLVDPADPTRTLLDRGEPGTALFGLSGDQTDAASGLVRFDGSAVEIDVSSLAAETQGRLVFQLLNQDSDVGTQVAVRKLSSVVDSTGAASLTFPNNTLVISPGNPVDLSSYGAETEIDVQFSNTRFDAASGNYTAAMRLQNNGPAVGRNLAVVFADLPAAVSLTNLSGTDDNGAPYVNVKPAIPAGGLIPSGFSDFVRVEFANPTAIPFPLQPMVLSGGVNQAPVFDPVGPLTVLPGGHLEIPLVATDPDGDAVTFSLQSDVPLPTGMLQGNGLLTFTPAPGEEGSYAFTVFASDGRIQVPQTVTLDVLADPITTTRISGTVLDIDGTPLPNVPISLSRLTVLTDATGHFTLELPPHLLPTEEFDIAVPAGDIYFDPFGTGEEKIDFRRAQYDTSTGTSTANPRRHSNLVTSFLDTSMVYGSDDQRALALRVLDGSGKLKTSPGDLLPLNNTDYFPDGPLENDAAGPADPTEMFVAGDVRASENPGLASLHTILLREHNRLADEIASADPSLTGDEIYNRARHKVSAIVQHITYHEYLPLLLGPNVLSPYAGYQASLEPGVGSFFATAAFRFGHSQAQAEIERRDDSGVLLDPISMRQSFFNTAVIQAEGVDAILRGIASQVSEEIDTQVIDGLRNNLFGPPGSGGIDLAALSIQRGRDLGLPSYNQARTDLGLTPVSSFAEITSNPQVQSNLQTTYETVAAIDAFVGGLAEDPLPGALVGELFHTALVRQFELTRDADRFWYENGQFTDAELAEIRGTTLSALIQRNSGITNLSNQVFTTGVAPASPAPAGTSAAGPASEFRTFDGSGNNANNPHWGQTGSHLLIDTSLNYADGISQPSGAERPGAREVSNGALNQTAPVPSTVGATTMFVFWGQLLAHDLSQTPTGISDSLKIQGDAQEIVGNSYPFVAEKLDLLLGHGVYEAVNNVIARPIYLPALDMANAVPIDPLVDTQVTTAAIPELEVFVAAGTLEDTAGEMFAGELSVTQVPRNLTPAALPPNLFPDLVVTIQPAEMVFTEPAPITFPNTAGYAPGAPMDLWSIDPLTGLFEIVGQMEVSADGASIETISGGIRTSSWHTPSPPPAPPTQPEPDPDGCPCDSNTEDVSSEVDLRTGALLETHELATYQSLGVDRGVVLAYDSLRANPTEIIKFGYDNIPASLLLPNDRIVASLQISGQGYDYQVPGSAEGAFGLPAGQHFWQVPSEGGDLNAAFLVDMSAFPDGVYRYDLSSGLLRLFGGTAFGSRASSAEEFIHVSSQDSPFGSGWGISGWQRIVESSNGSALLVNGSGSEMLFSAPPTPEAAFVSPAADFSVLERLGDGTFRRTMKDQTVYQFNARHELATMTDRNGNVTEYVYNAADQLIKIIDPVGLETLFAYTGDRVSSITDPANRITLLEYDADGNLERITDPDGTFRTFQYDADQQMIGEINKLGDQEVAEYGFAGRISGGIKKDGTVIEVVPIEMQALHPAHLTVDPDTAPLMVPREQTLGAFYADSNGNVKRTVLDRFGQTSTQQDGEGSVKQIFRNEDGLVTRSINGRGNQTLYTYDENGNVTSIEDEIVSFSPPENAVFWDADTGGDWNDPKNWSSGFVPGPDDFAVIDVPNVVITVTHDIENTVVGGLYSNEALEIRSGSLTVTEDSRTFNSITVSPRASLAADGTGVSFTASGPTTIDGASLFATNGATLSLPFAVSFTKSLHLATFETRGAGSRLDLSSLTILAALETAFGRSGSLFIDALEGGVIDLSNVAEITGGYTKVVADGTGSTVDFTSLTSWIDHGRSFSVNAEAIDGGEITVPSLTSLDGVNLNLNATGTLSTSQITSFQNGKINVDGVATDLTSLTNIDGASFVVRDGATLSIPNAVSYETGRIRSTRFEARGAGSRLDLPSLITLVGGLVTRSLNITAMEGGAIDLSNVAEINGGYTAVMADGTGSTVDFTSLTSWNSRINHNLYVAFAEATDGGEITVPNLVSLSGVNLNLNDTGTLATSQITSFQDGEVELTGDVTVNLTSLTNIDRSNFRVQDGATLSIPNAVSYVGSDISFRPTWFEARGAGSRLDLPFLTTLAGGVLSRGTLFIDAVEGGVVDLSNLAEITGGVTKVSANGAESTVVLASLTNINGASFAVRGGATLSLPNAASYVGNIDPFIGLVTLTFEARGAGSRLDLSSLTTLAGSNDTRWNRNLKIDALEGGVIDLGNVAEIIPFNGSTRVVADGAGSTIDLTNLTSWNSAGFAEANDGGEITVPNLLNLSAVDLNLNATGTLSTSQITTYQNGTISIDGVPADLTSLTNIDGASFVVRDGATLSIPNAVSYTGSNSFDTTFEARGAGSRLDLSSLTTLAGGTNFYHLNIDALEEGVVDLSNVAEITGGATEVVANGANSTVDLTNLTSWIDDASDLSFAEELNGGSILLPNLVTVVDVELRLGGEPAAAALFAPAASLTSSTAPSALAANAAAPVLAATATDAPPALAATAASTAAVVVDLAPLKFTYDPNFSQLTSSIDELGRQTLYDIDPANGNTLSETRVVGQVDSLENGETDDLVTTFTYTTFGLMDTVTDPLGRVTDYDYDAFGRLTRVTYAVGTAEEASVQYEYDLAGNNTAIIDELGHRTEYTYDALNRMTQIVEADPDGTAGPLTAPTTTMQYDAYGNLLSIADPLSNTTSYTYDVEHRVISATDAHEETTTYTYDNFGNLSSTVDRLGRETEYVYDQRHRLVETVNPEGGHSFFSYDLDDNLTELIDENGNATTYTYDARSRLTSTTDALGGVMVYEYDAADNLIAMTDELGRRTAYEYDELDREIRLILPDPDQAGPDTSPIYQYAYDKASNLRFVTDALGNTTEYQFDNRDRLLGQVDPDPDGAGPLLSPTTLLSYDDANRLTRIVDPLARETSYTYDDLNRLIAETYPDPDGAGPLAAPVMTYTYDAVGNELSMTDALGNLTAYAYDDLYRLVEMQEQDPDGAGPAASPVTNYVYDAEDQLLSISDPLARTTNYTYDLLGRMTQITQPDPDGAGPLNAPVMTYTYDEVGNELSMTDPVGNVTQYEYDALYRLTRQIDEDLDGPAGPLSHPVTTFTYDAVDNLLSLTDPENNATSYVYDDLDRVTTETIELGPGNFKSRRYVYDLMDNITTHTDRNDRTIQYEYDNLYRVTAERWLDDVGTEIHTIEQDYDIASQLLRTEDLTVGSRYDYTYDDLGRVTQTVLANGGPTVVFADTYNANSLRTSLAAQVGGVADFLTTYQYDGLNRSSRIEQQGQLGGAAVAAKRIDLGYNADDQFTVIERFNTLAGGAGSLVATTDYGYDGIGRLTNLTHSNSTTALTDYSWAFDAASRITQYVNSVDGTSDYTYDNGNQVTGATYDYQSDETYAYDENGNRTNTGYQTGFYNRLISDGTYNYEYDAEGNRTKRTHIATGEVTEYEWDHRNRLVKVTDRVSDGGAITQTVSHRYDTYNRWISKTVDADGNGPRAGETTRYEYDGNQIVLALDEAGNVTNRYLWGPAVDQLLADEQASGEVLWALTDHLGTVRDLVDNTGTVRNHITYDAFGNVTNETDAAIDELFGYTGRALDESTGLQNNLHRWYDAATGRWISEDPIGFDAGDANLYAYVDNNPLIYIDPDGLTRKPTTKEVILTIIMNTSNPGGSDGTDVTPPPLGGPPPQTQNEPLTGRHEQKTTEKVNQERERNINRTNSSEPKKPGPKKSGPKKSGPKKPIPTNPLQLILYLLFYPNSAGYGSDYVDDIVEIVEQESQVEGPPEPPEQPEGPGSKGDC